MSYYQNMSTGTAAGPDAAGDLPGWECWTGPDHQVCAALRGSSPPVVLTGRDWADLREKIRSYVLMQLL